MHQGPETLRDLPLPGSGLPARRFRRGRWLWLVFGVSAFCTQAGCVHRRLTVRSDPPGALVQFEGQEVGYSPVSLDFTYYGTREITLTKAGYETERIYQRISPPWYQVPPLDFFSDNLWPFPVTDRRDFTYQLRKQRIVPTGEVVGRGEALRSEAHMGP